MKVAVIGAGASGLAAIKCCLDEGLKPDCFERSEHIGGLWYYQNEAIDGQASVMKSTVINTSKEMMSYSDFPIPAQFPVFMHNTYVQRYMTMYAETFGLTKHIRFHTEVLSVKRCKDFETTGLWNIQIRDLSKGGLTEDLVYDAVMICTGHHAEKNVPTFPGLDKFKGEVIHSHDYKHSKGYEDKRILIIGIGNSGGDAAVELSRVASQVYLSTRRGSWVLNRVAENGYPVDMLALNRVNKFLFSFAPQLVNTIAERKANKKFDHAVYSLKPKHRMFSQHPMVNDDLPNRIICGSVIIKSDVVEFTENGVRFSDNTVEDNIDVVFLATGYVFGFPFLEESVVTVMNNEVDLFKYAFPPELAKPTLAVIGCFQPLGAIFPISELQCRLATRIFKGDVKLPSKTEMWEDIHVKKTQMSQKYVKSLRHTIQVDFIPFCDELAKLAGCFPNFKKLFLTDPVLALKCIFDPCTPYQYRLHGPGAWTGARKAIMTQWDRTVAPLKTRPLDLPKETSQIGFFLFFFCFIAVFITVLSVFMGVFN